MKTTKKKDILETGKFYIAPVKIEKETINIQLPKNVIKYLGLLNDKNLQIFWNPINGVIQLSGGMEPTLTIPTMALTQINSNHINQMISNNNKLIDFTLGTDPEFCCINPDGQIVSAGDWVSQEDGIEFGRDGCDKIFEARPVPSKNPLEVINNIRDIFIRQIIEEKEFLKFKWVSRTWWKTNRRVTGRDGYSFGGHIHFGVSEKIINPIRATEYLDDYVGSLSLLLEHKDEGKRRRENGYGCMGDMRTQEWGFEYRTPSSWVSTPYISTAMLCLSKTVMYEIINNKNFNWHKFAMEDDFYEMNQKRIFEKFPEIWKDITQMRLYQTYKPYIDIIYFLIKNKKTWLHVRDMKECWGITDMEQCINNPVNLDFLWYRYNNEQ